MMGLRYVSSMKRLIAVVAFEGVQLLDVTGPLEVFARTTRWLEENQHPSTGPRYQVEVLGLTAGPLKASSGLGLVASRGLRSVSKGVDTLLVAGGVGVHEASRSLAFLRWLQRMAPRVRRFGSICTGAFALAAAGLLEGRRATTHWRYVEAL